MTAVQGADPGTTSDDKVSEDTLLRSKVPYFG